MSVRCLKCTRVHEHSGTSLCTTITRRPIIDLLDIVSTWFLVQFTISRLLDTIYWSTRKPFKPHAVSRKISLFITPCSMWILDQIPFLKIINYFYRWIKMILLKNLWIIRLIKDILYLYNIMLNWFYLISRSKSLCRWNRASQNLVLRI